jgi:hypothetical protein
VSFATPSSEAFSERKESAPRSDRVAIVAAV